MAKRICFIDDSVEFDGFSPTSRPLDGPQKALVYLAASLAQRGHEVTVITRSQMSLICDGVTYPGWYGEKPAALDLAIAVNDPALLDRLPGADKRVVWVSGDPGLLDGALAQEALTRLHPAMVFATDAQRDCWTNRQGMPVHILAGAPAPSCVEDFKAEPATPPQAVCVCHPLNGLGEVLDVWLAHVQSAAPHAELHIYSALLDRAALSGEVPDDLQAIHQRVAAAQGQNVRVRRPQPDPQMADIYRAARVFMHPGLASEKLAYALQEAQAAGLPAVSYITGRVARERIMNGQTGRLCTTAEEYGDAVVKLLNGDEPFATMAATCREWQRGRSWAIAAAEWEERFA